MGLILILFSFGLLFLGGIFTKGLRQRGSIWRHIALLPFISLFFGFLFYGIGLLKGESHGEMQELALVVSFLALIFFFVPVFLHFLFLIYRRRTQRWKREAQLKKETAELDEKRRVAKQKRQEEERNLDHEHEIFVALLEKQKGRNQIELSEEAQKLVKQLASLQKTVEDEITLLADLASRHPQIGQITKTRGANNQDVNIISQIKSALEQIEKKKNALAESG